MKKISIILAVIILALISFKEDNIIIPENAIRFRVIANSNTLEDQTIKNKLSINLESYIYNLTKDAKSSEETKQILNANHENIENFVDNYMDINNINQEYSLSIGRNYFPTKQYKGVKYSSGYYDSVVLNLGSSNGMNWWCIIYPPLCLLDETTEDVKYTTLVQEMLKKYNI